MVRSRPFSGAGELFVHAAQAWRDLDSSDWLEAFRAHPRIGERASSSAAAGTRAAEWSANEQSAVAASRSVEAALGETNRTYEDRFGHIFIICATGRTATEILASMRERLGNDPARELEIAAGEQQQITRLRLQKLLNDQREREPGSVIRREKRS